MTAKTVPQAGYGVTVSWAGHDVGYLLDVNYSGISMGTVDVSSHEAVYNAFVGGKVDGGELTLPVRFIAGDTTGQKYLWADIKAKAERQAIITFPDSTTMTFNALCTKFGDFTFPMEGSIDATLVLKVTGEPTFSEFDT